MPGGVNGAAVAGPRRIPVHDGDAIPVDRTAALAREMGRYVSQLIDWVVTSCGSQALLQARAEFDGDERKHKFNSLSAGAHEVTAEDVEAYKMTKARPDDPMANFKDSDSDAGGKDSASSSGSSTGSGSDSDSDSDSDGKRKHKSKSKRGASKRRKSSSSKKKSSKKRRHGSDSD